MTNRRWWLITVPLTNSVIAQGVAEAGFFAQTQKLDPPYDGDAASFDQFGKSIGISGEVAAVGATYVYFTGLLLRDGFEEP